MDKIDFSSSAWLALGWADSASADGVDSTSAAALRIKLVACPTATEKI